MSRPVAVKRKVEVLTKEEVKATNQRLITGGRNTSPPPSRPSPTSSPMRSGHIRPRLNLRDLVATHKKRKEKAVQRRRKYEMRLRATRGEQGLLEMHSIKEPQRRDYLQKLDGFYSFIAQYELPTTTEGQLDAALCEYADLLYLDGYGSRRETDGGHRIHPAGVRSGRHFASSPPPALVERLETTRTESGENADDRIPEIRCERVQLAHALAKRFALGPSTW